MTANTGVDPKHITTRSDSVGSNVHRGYDRTGLILHSAWVLSLCVLICADCHPTE